MSPSHVILLTAVNANFFKPSLMNQQHMQTHRKAQYGCVFCENMYRSYSDMFRHIESGYCRGGSADKLARILKYSGPWIFEPSSGDRPESYLCDGCQRDFRDLGSLVAHMENSRSCEELLEIVDFDGELREYWE